MLKKALPIKGTWTWEKYLFPHENCVISMLVRKLMVTQKQKYLSPGGWEWVGTSPINSGP